MYQIVGLPFLLKVFGWLVAILALLVAAITLPTGMPTTGLGWAQLAFSAAGTGVTIAMAVVAALANKHFFTWCCRHRLTCSVFPDLAGDWVGELRSNWPRIEARGAENVGNIALLSRPARATITTNLFTLCMELATDDRYSTSSTFTSRLSKDPTTGEIAVCYLYTNTTLDPKATDIPSHQGAAKLTLRREGDNLILEGPYWTNRAWSQGLNTAGIATFRKPIRI